METLHACARVNRSKTCIPVAKNTDSRISIRGDSADLEEPDVIAEEIADDLEAALEQFAMIAADLRERKEASP